MNSYWNDGTELYHFGILGMKWGVRRFENYDGTLTEAGKRRYYNKDGTLTKAGIAEYATKNRKIVDSAAEEKKKEIDYKDLEDKSNKLNDLANSLGDDYDKLYKSLTKNTDFRDAVYKYMKDNDLGTPLDYDDEDYLEWTLEEAVDSVIPNFLSKQMAEKHERFEAAQNAYWDAIHSYSKDLIDKYGDLPVTDEWGTGYKKGADYLKNYLWDDKNQKWNAYVSRHFEDYWVNDVDSRYALMKTVSYDDYKNRYLKH